MITLSSISPTVNLCEQGKGALPMLLKIGDFSYSGGAAYFVFVVIFFLFL